MLASLEVECAKFLKEHINAEAASTILSIALVFENLELKEECEKFISENALAVVQSNAFKEIDLRTLGAILQLNMDNIKEMELFTEVHKLNQRSKCFAFLNVATCSKNFAMFFQNLARKMSRKLIL